MVAYTLKILIFSLLERVNGYELFSQNQLLAQQLKEALAEIQLLKAEIKELKDNTIYHKTSLLS